jgi:hypothetical protein
LSYPHFLRLVQCSTLPLLLVVDYNSFFMLFSFVQVEGPICPGTPARDFVPGVGSAITVVHVAHLLGLGSVQQAISRLSMG